MASLERLPQVNGTWPHLLAQLRTFLAARVSSRSLSRGPRRLLMRTTAASTTTAAGIDFATMRPSRKQASSACCRADRYPTVSGPLFASFKAFASCFPIAASSFSSGCVASSRLRPAYNPRAIPSRSRTASTGKGASCATVIAYTRTDAAATAPTIRGRVTAAPRATCGTDVSAASGASCVVCPPNCPRKVRSPLQDALGERSQWAKVDRLL